MGIQDLERIYPLYRYLTDCYSKFRWEIDSGQMETVIAIQPDGKFWRPKVLGDAEPEYCRIFVPDIMCYHAKIIIEYQEQPHPRKHRGRYKKKGHTELSDETKDSFYTYAGFRQIKIWDDDPHWKITLDTALVKLL